MKKVINLAVIAGMFAMASCLKIEELPDIPHIEFRSFTVFDTIDILGNNSRGGRLLFYFEDGNGDVGLDAPTKDQTDTTNLFFTLYRKTKGQMVQAPANDPLRPSSYRIPYMERTGQNKILKGTVSVVFFYLFYSAADTISYDFYIEDRAMNQSNVASTGEIVLVNNKTYQ
jgi:hypothetical protein